jgi:hypothetical protein
MCGMQHAALCEKRMVIIVGVSCSPECNILQYSAWFLAGEIFKQYARRKSPMQ